MRYLINLLFKYYFIRTVRGRYINENTPSLGRFSNRELYPIYKTINQIRKKFLLDNALTHYIAQGNKLMVYCGVLSLAAYRSFRISGLSHQYATSLVSDIIWKLYILGAKILWLCAGLVTRNPQKRLNKVLMWLCKFPFNQDPKGYQYEVQVMPNHLAMNFTQCAVHQFMLKSATKEEMDFFNKSWCQFDFALPGYLTDGGFYERNHTLSAGDSICDMKWYANDDFNKDK